MGFVLNVAVVLRRVCGVWQPVRDVPAVPQTHDALIINIHMYMCLYKLDVWCASRYALVPAVPG